MPRRWPILPTLLVAAAIATMIALGIWQLQRAKWKEGLLVTYAAAAHKPPVDFPLDKNKPLDPYYFRKSAAHCYTPYDAISSAGRNAAKQSGLAHVVTCNAFSPGTSMDERKTRITFRAVLGWSDDIAAPDWKGGELSGTLMPDTQTGVRLIADPPVAGLQANEPPNLDDIPNNHLAYAGQWFFFALVAGIIYVLALKRRARD
ncbi:SURF1 family protein [Pseudonocardia sp. TMWB2A]|uniref:SURF1 family protein n=1 Tax=Pseudonocardia sp. TMWB2A TaxID=687430 RepID=UPI00307F1641